MIPPAADAQIPQWYLDGRSSEYPSSRYIVGVGEGRSQEDAAGQARAAVGAQIRVQVESEITSITREMEVDDHHTFETMFNNATTSIVDESLQGLDLARQAEHAGMYYALAALNRDRYLSELRSDLSRLEDRYASLREGGRSQIRDGNIFAGITNFLDAQNIASEFYAAMSTYNALSEAPYGSGDVLRIAEMVPEIRNILTSVRVSVLSGDEQTGDRGRQLSDPLVFKATYHHDDGEAPVPNLPLRIAYQDGTEADLVTTESDGRASIYLTAYPVRSEVNQVTVEPLFTEIPANYRNVIRNMTIRATYRIAQSERKPVALIITDDKGQRLGQLEQRIGGVIERLGYQISDEAEVVIEGSVSLMDFQEVSGLSGKQTVARTELSLLVKDRTSNAVIGSISGEGTGMSTRGESDALRASQNRINVNRRELSEVLAVIGAE